MSALNKGVTARVAAAEYLAAIAAARLAGVKPYLSSGLDSVDAKFPAWLHNGHLVTLAGRPGQGKTALAQQIAEHVARDGKKSVFFFSLEMPAGELVARSVTRTGRVDATALKLDTLTPDQELVRDRAVARFAGLPLTIFTCRQIDAILKAVADGVKDLAAAGAPPLGLIVVDYLQKIEGKGADLKTIVSANTAALKQLAVAQGVPMLALAQLNRNATGRSDPRPIQSDLKESGTIEAESDLVLYVYREDEAKPEADIGTLKVRHIPDGVQTVNFDGKYITFGDKQPSSGQLSLVESDSTSRRTPRGQRAL